MASGNNLTNQVPFRLMKGRLGVYEKHPYDAETNSIEGVANQSVRFRHNGGNK